MESPLSGTTTLVTHDNVQLERLYCTWPTTPAFNKHEPALDLLAVILGQGKSSRLHRKLVHDGEIAKDVSVASYSQEIAGEFIIQVTTSPNKSTDQIMGSTSIADSIHEKEPEHYKNRRGDDFSKMDKKLALDMMRQEMLEAAENLNFERAAKLRDEISLMEKELAKVF